MKMELFDNIPSRAFRNPSVTIGSFDGVHIGHKKIIAALLAKAAELNGDSIVLTFETHPRTVINPEFSLKILTTNREKTDILRSLGVKHVLMLRFCREMANLTASDFYRRLLVERLGVRSIIVGYDHVFGKDREGGIELLERLGREADMDVLQVSEETIAGEAVSSTRIRRELSFGNIVLANEMLGRPYSFGGSIVGGEGRGGSLLGYPTANIRLDDKKVVPGDGVYAVSVFLDKDSEKNGMLNIGANPTFEASQRTIEVNIFGLNENLYGREITVHFHEKIRGEIRFSGINELKKQLSADKEHVLNFFSQKAAGSTNPFSASSHSV